MSTVELFTGAQQEGACPVKFKNAMRLLAGGVAIITTCHEGRRWGLTATALCSVSTEPPRLLVCINQSAEAHGPIRKSKRLAVNLLDADDRAVAERFSGADGSKGEQRFDGLHWNANESGLPIFMQALAAFECSVEHEMSCGSHTVAICRVEQVHCKDSDESLPLIYFDRRFRTAGVLPQR